MYNLPPGFRKGFPVSKSALGQSYKAHLKKENGAYTRRAKCFARLENTSKDMNPKKYQKLIKGLKRNQQSLLNQIRTQDIGLNAFLHCIGKAPTELCKCAMYGNALAETPFHVIMICKLYDHQRAILKRKLGRHVGSYVFLLSSPLAQPHLLRFLASTKCFTRYSNLLPTKS